MRDEEELPVPIPEELHIKHHQYTHSKQRADAIWRTRWMKVFDALMVWAAVGFATTLAGVLLYALKVYLGKTV
jgi:hypothetical protein